MSGWCLSEDDYLDHGLFSPHKAVCAFEQCNSRHKHDGVDVKMCDPAEHFIQLLNSTPKYIAIISPIGKL